MRIPRFWSCFTTCVVLSISSFFVHPPNVFAQRTTSSKSGDKAERTVNLKLPVNIGHSLSQAITKPDASLFPQLLPAAADIDAWEKMSPPPATAEVTKLRREREKHRKQLLKQFTDLKQKLAKDRFEPAKISYQGTTLQQDPDKRGTEFTSLTLKFSMMRPRQGAPGRVDVYNLKIVTGSGRRMGDNWVLVEPFKSIEFTPLIVAGTSKPNAPGKPAVNANTSITMKKGGTAKVQLPGTSVSVVMPERPKMNQLVGNTPFGALNISVFTIDKGDYVYNFTVTRYPPDFFSRQKLDTDAALKKAADSPIKDLQGSKLISRRTLKVKRLPAIEQKFERPETADAPPVTVLSRMVLDGNTSYVVQATVDQSKYRRLRRQVDTAFRKMCSSFSRK